MLIELRDPFDPIIRQLAAEHHAELSRLGTDLRPYAARSGLEFVAGFVAGRPVGCAAIEGLGDGVAAIKRMYVRPAHRRQGLSRLILAALEERAVQRGYHTVRLEIHGYLPAALALYRSAGYDVLPGDGEPVPASFCFTKSLVPVEAWSV